VAWLSILVFVCLYSAIPALSVQLAINYLFKFKPSFKYIFLLVLTSLLVSTFVDIFIHFVTSTDSAFKQDTIFIPIITCFLARFMLFAKFIKQPEASAIGESKALKIVVLATIIEIIITLLIGLIIMVLFNVTH